MFGPLDLWSSLAPAMPTFDGTLHPADDELLLAAEAAIVASPLKSAGTSQLPRLVIGALTHRQPQLVGDSVVADRLRRTPGHECANVFEYGH